MRRWSEIGGRRPHRAHTTRSSCACPGSWRTAEAAPSTHVVDRQAPTSALAEGAAPLGEKPQRRVECRSGAADRSGGRPPHARQHAKLTGPCCAPCHRRALGSAPHRRPREESRASGCVHFQEQRASEPCETQNLHPHLSANPESRADGIFVPHKSTPPGALPLPSPQPVLRPLRRLQRLHVLERPIVDLRRFPPIQPRVRVDLAPVVHVVLHHHH